MFSVHCFYLRNVAVDASSKTVTLEVTRAQGTYGRISVSYITTMLTEKYTDNDLVINRAIENKDYAIAEGILFFEPGKVYKVMCLATFGKNFWRLGLGYLEPMQGHKFHPRYLQSFILTMLPKRYKSNLQFYWVTQSYIFYSYSALRVGRKREMGVDKTESHRISPS